MAHLRKIRQEVSIILLLVCILGLYFYLGGPQESSASLGALTEREILVKAYGNETVYLSPFERKELIEYHVANLSEFLLNRTINIKLEAQSECEVAFSLMNSSQFKRWENGSTSDEIIFQNFTSTQLTFSPQDPWSLYFLVLQSKENSNATIKLMTEQLFLVRIFDYETAFNWLRIASFTAVASFVLQFCFKSTLGHLWRRVEYFTIRSIFGFLYGKDKAKKYIAYMVREPLYTITIVFCIIGAILILSAVFITLSADQMFIFVNQLWKDYWYRSCLEIIFLAILIISIFMLAMTTWDLSYYPVLANYYPDQELKRKNDEAFISFLIKYLLSPYTAIFYLFFGVWMIFVFQAKIETFLPMFLMLLAPFLIFIGYIATQAEFGVQIEVLATPFQNLEQDFKFYKATFGSGLILSFFVVYAFQSALIVLEPISRFIVDSGILASHSRESWLWGAAQVINEVKQITSVLAYLLPLSVLIVYYSLTFFTIVPAYLSKSIRDYVYLQKASIILKDSLLDLIFFIIAFWSSTWLQSLLVPIRYEQVLISLASSFIATSFKNYLQALIKIPT